MHLDVDAGRASARARLGEHPGEQGAPDPPPPVRRQEGQVDDAEVVGAAVHGDPPRQPSADLDNVVARVRGGRPVVALLGVVLHPDEGLALAKSLGAETIDLQRGMREVQRRLIESNATAKPEDQVRLHVKDGIHLEEIGQVSMAYAMLKGLGAPEEVSSVTLSFTGDSPETKGCKVSDVVKSENGIAFTRLDKGLPLSLGPFTAFQFRWVPMQDGINQYFLRVRDLPEGEYEIKVDGRLIGKSKAADLARGQNICTMTTNGWEPGGPWEAQSCVVKELVDARDKLWMGGVLQARLLPEGGDTKAILQDVAKQDAALVNLERHAAKPRPYRFELSLAKP